MEKLSDIRIETKAPVTRVAVDGVDCSKVSKLTYTVEAGQVPLLTLEIPVDDAQIIGRALVKKKFPDRVAGEEGGEERAIHY